jgi:hypothetical protein
MTSQPPPIPHQHRAISTIRVVVQSDSPPDFIRDYSLDATHRGLVLRTRLPDSDSAPLAQLVFFRFHLRGGALLFTGLARVTRVQRGNTTGLELQFAQLDPGGKILHRKMLQRRRKLMAQAAHSREVTKVERPGRQPLRKIPSGDLGDKPVSVPPPLPALPGDTDEHPVAFEPSGVFDPQAKTVDDVVFYAEVGQGSAFDEARTSEYKRVK